MHKYIVDSAEQITATTLLLSLKEQDGQRLFSFQPGQYAAVSFYHQHRPTPARCFSIVSSPTEQRTLKFSMRTKGRFTKAAANLQPGSIVNVRGPYGGFVLDLARGEDVVFLAGGIGITPFMSMVTYASSVRASTKITLIYSCQTQDDIPFLTELSNLTRQNSNLKVVYVVGSGSVDKLAGLPAVVGRVTPELLDGILNSSYHFRVFYICGPPPYMNAMSKTLQTKGVAKDRIMTEAFAQGSHPQTGKMRNWPYNIYALSAASVILGSLAVTISDILKILPPASIINSANLSPTLTSTNSRQQDLDALVNGLPVLGSSTPESAAAQAAAKANNTAVVTPTTPSGTTTTAAPTTTKTTTPTAPIVTQTPVVTPTPAPAPKTCTTTQSGVTTCV